MTRDNVPVTVDAVVYFRVVDPQAAVVKVENFLKATSLMSQTTLRSVLGRPARRSAFATRVDQPEVAGDHRPANRTVGVKVTAVEVKDVACRHDETRDGQAAEAERERRAKIVNAKANFRPRKKWCRPPR